MVFSLGCSSKERHSITTVSSISVGLAKNGLTKYLSNFHFKIITRDNMVNDKHKKG